MKGNTHLKWIESNPYGEHIWRVVRLDANNKPVNEYGPIRITFDKKHVYNLWQDYPWRFSPEEREIFAREMPYWADFFKDRDPNEPQDFEPDEKPEELICE